MSMRVCYLWVLHEYCNTSMHKHIDAYAHVYQVYIATHMHMHICDPALENRAYVHKILPFTLLHLSQILCMQFQFCKMHVIPYCLRH